MAEERDLEKCNFRNFRSLVTLILTLDRVVVILPYLVEIYPRTKLDQNRKNFVDGRTDVSSNIRSSLDDDLNGVCGIDFDFRFGFLQKTTESFQFGFW